MKLDEQIREAIQICDDQIDGQNDEYAGLWKTVKEALMAKDKATK